MENGSTRLRGTVRVHPRGFGFLVPEHDEGRSAFIAPPDLNPLLEGDRVEAEVRISPDGRASASSCRLLERPRKRVFGKVVTHHGALHVKVDREVANRDWPLDTTKNPAVRPGAMVIAAVVGDHVTFESCLDPSSDPAIERIVVRHDLPAEFPVAVLDEAESVEEAPIRQVARRDLRELPTVTVDAAASRDLDDAISALPADAEGALRLLVSISDVAAWVSAGSALDVEAFHRATSVYLPDRVLPMLPPSLSEDGLSLLPESDRTAITVELRITPEGEIPSVDIYRSRIRSDRRLSYDQAAAFVDDGVLETENEALREMLGWCRTAWARLSQARARRGGLETAREEARVGLDPHTGRPTVLTPQATSTAHEMIERFMVAANEAVAGWLEARGVPCPFRVHDEPNESAVRRMAAMATNFGFLPGFGSRLTPLALAALERQIRNASATPAIVAVMNKALGPARYSVQPSLHFGLATSRYVHFTSPIRRYADLLVHRAVSGYLEIGRAHV